MISDHLMPHLKICTEDVVYRHYQAVIRVGQRCAFLQGVPCDLVTGEDRTFVDPEGRQSGHVACTIEMCSVNTPCKSSTLSAMKSISTSYFGE